MDNDEAVYGPMPDDPEFQRLLNLAKDAAISAYMAEILSVQPSRHRSSFIAVSPRLLESHDAE